MIQTNRSYSSIACTSNYSNPPPSTMPPARGAKTLGWFMEADFLKGQQQQMNGQGAPAQTTTYGAAAGAGVIRRGSSSDDSKSTTPSSTRNGTPQHHHHQYQPQQHRQTIVSSTSSSSNPQNNSSNSHQKKQKKYSKRVPASSSAHGAARKEGFHAAGGQMSESSEDGCATVPPPTVIPATSTAATVPPGPPPTVPQSGANQEEYWFYDVATDGYYYEQNGAKGWRRRQPNAAVHKANGKEQEVAHMNVNGRGKYDQLLAAQAAAAHAAYLQHAIQMMSSHQNPSGSSSTGPQNPQMPAHLNPPTMRYYDPNSDGFYYEMASVDGWKRRQPNKPASASLPHGMLSSRQPPPGAMMMAPPLPPPPRGMFPPEGSMGGSSYGAALARGQFPRNTVKHPEDPLQLLHHSGTETPAPPSRDSAASSSSMSAGGDSCCFAELFGTGSGSGSSGTTSVPRPSSLNLEQKPVSPQIENTTPLDSSIGLLNAILADFNGGGKTYNNYASLNSILPPIPGMNSQQNSPMKGATPGDSWNSFRSCSLFSPIKPSKRVLVPSAQTPLGSAPNQQPMGMGMMDQDGDDTLNMVMRDLDKLWTTTPVSGLNQA